MHNSSVLRMQWFVDNYVSKITKKEKIKVLDVGSYNVNGSYKHLFPKDKFDYFGLDIEAGPNVDIVLENPYKWTALETESFDVIISGQAFEHTEFFWITMSEIARVLKKDGLVCIIAPNGFHEHRFPVDCYRFFSDGMVALARYVSLEPLHAHTNCAPSTRHKRWYSNVDADSVLIAEKRYSGETKYVDMDSYVCHPPNQKKLRTGLVPHDLHRNIIRSLIRRMVKIASRYT